MRRVEPVQRRLRSASVLLAVTADVVQAGTIDLTQPQSGSLPYIGTGLTGFNSQSRWRLERVSALFSSLNETFGFVSFSAAGETTENFCLMPGVPSIDIGWTLPVGWTGLLTVTPFLWEVTADSQSLMVVHAQFREDARSEEQPIAALCAL